MTNKEKYEKEINEIFNEAMKRVEELSHEHGRKEGESYLAWSMRDCEEERQEEILTKEEKKFLSRVIAPFRYNVSYIIKDESFNGEFIKIVGDIGGVEDHMRLPWFAKGTMYKGMIANKRYSLAELGL